MVQKSWKNKAKKHLLWYYLLPFCQLVLLNLALFLARPDKPILCFSVFNLVFFSILFFQWWNSLINNNILVFQFLDPILIFDKKKRKFLQYNHAFENVFGQLFSNPDDALLNLMNNQTFIRQITSNLTNGFDFDLKDQNGKPTYFVITQTRHPFRKKIIYISFRNVTGQKLYEDRLIKSIARNKGIIESSPSGISIIDKNGIQKFASRKAREIFGYDSIEETPGNEIFLYFHPEEHERLKSYLSLPAHPDQIWKERFKVIHKKGHTFIAEICSKGSVDQETAMEETIMVFNDVTDIAIKEAALKDSEERYKLLVETIPGGISILDLYGNYKFVSQGIWEIFGYDSLEDFCTIPLIQHFAEGYYDILGSTALKLLNNEECPLIRMKARHKDGHFIYIEGKAKLLPLQTGQTPEFLLVFNEVTDKVEAEKIIREREATLNAIMNSNPDSIFVVDNQKKFISFNPQARKEFIIYYNTDIKLGLTYEQILKEPFVKMYDDILEIVNRGQTYKRFFETPLDETGKRRFFDINYAPARNHEGKIFGMISISRDITDLIEKETALETSENQYRNIFNHSHQGIIIFDFVKNQLLDCNTEALKIFGYEDKSCFLNIHPSELLAPIQLTKESSEIFITRISEEIISSKKYQYIFLGLKPDGKEFIGEKTAILDSSAENQFLFFVSDITHKFNAHKEIEERKAIYEALVNNSFDAIDILEIPSDFGVSETKLLIRNKVMNDMFNNKLGIVINPEDMLKMSPKIQPNGLPSEELLDLIMAEITENGKGKFEWQLIHPDGHMMELEVMVQLLFVNQRVFVVRILKDITEQKKQGELIRQQIWDLNHKNLELKKYIDSNMELENFAYIASHDLQAPLRTISNFTQLLERNLKDQLTQQQLGYMEFIINGVRSMHRLINDLLTYSRANTSKRVVSKISIADLIEEIKKELHTSIWEKQVVIQTHHLPKEIIGDPVKIKQLFQNLLTNAIKFNEPGSIPVIEIDSKESENFWHFSVKDNGIGIDPEFQDKIFLLFKRLHSDHEFEGTGIGLALCKKLVEQHNGKIGVISEPGKGSVFHFSISKHLENHPEELVMA